MSKELYAGDGSVARYPTKRVRVNMLIAAEEPSIDDLVRLTEHTEVLCNRCGNRMHFMAEESVFGSDEGMLRHMKEEVARFIGWLNEMIAECQRKTGLDYDPRQELFATEIERLRRRILGND